MTSQIPVNIIKTRLRSDDSALVPLLISTTFGGYDVIVVHSTPKTAEAAFKKMQRKVEECRLKMTVQFERTSYSYTPDSPTIFYFTAGAIIEPSFRKLLRGMHKRSVVVLNDIHKLTWEMELCIAIARIELQAFKPTKNHYRLLLLSDQLNMGGSGCSILSNFFASRKVKCVRRELSGGQTPDERQIYYGHEILEVPSTNVQPLVRRCFDKLMSIRQRDQIGVVVVFVPCLRDAILLKEMWLQCRCHGVCPSTLGEDANCPWKSQQEERLTMSFQAGSTEKAELVPGVTIISSNIIEQSKWMSKAKYVVDSGLVRRVTNYYGIRHLMEKPATRFEVDQRANCSRIDAVIYRLYAESTYRSMEDEWSETKYGDSRLVLAKLADVCGMTRATWGNFDTLILSEPDDIQQWTFDDLCRIGLLTGNGCDVPGGQLLYDINRCRLKLFTNQNMDFNGSTVAMNLIIDRSSMYKYYVAAWFLVNEPNFFIPHCFSVAVDKNETPLRPRTIVRKDCFNDNFSEMTTMLCLYQAFVPSTDKGGFCEKHGINLSAIQNVEKKFHLAISNTNFFESERDVGPNGKHVNYGLPNMWELPIRTVHREEFKRAFRAEVAKYMQVANPQRSGAAITYSITHSEEQQFNAQIADSDALYGETGKFYCDGLRSFSGNQYIFVNTMRHEDQDCRKCPALVCSCSQQGFDASGEHRPFSNKLDFVAQKPDIVSLLHNRETLGLQLFCSETAFSAIEPDNVEPVMPSNRTLTSL